MTHRKALHVGCGAATLKSAPRYFHGPEWEEVRLDINPDAKPDIVASMLDMSPVASASMDALYSSHNVEHVHPHEVDIVLREFRRVLKPDGLCVVTVPDLQSVAALVAQDCLEDTAYVSPAGPIAPLDILYGHRASMAGGNLFMAHKTGFTAKTLGQALLRAGFAQVSVQRVPAAFALWALAYPTAADDERRTADQTLVFRPTATAAPTPPVLSGV